jgi:hypothetical protein
MDAERAWDWEIRYDLGQKRCGMFGTASSESRAMDRVRALLAGLPLGTVATGQLMLMGAILSPMEGRPLLRTIAHVERTSEDQIIWATT